MEGWGRPTAVGQRQRQGGVGSLEQGCEGWGGGGKFKVEHDEPNDLQGRVPAKTLVLVVVQEQYSTVLVVLAASCCTN